jgi:hypothetical protein
MDNLLLIALEAHHPERNHHRRYEISVGRDLLGDWTVTVRYGRAGSPLRCLRFAGADEAVMRRLVRERLARRFSAPRRIGCAYQPQEITAAPGVAMGAWIPPAVLGRLLDVPQPSVAA